MSNSLLPLTAIFQLVTVILVFIVYRRRKETGFLFVAIGLVVQLISSAIFVGSVFLRLFGLLYVIPPEVTITFVSFFSIITSVLSLIGWVLLSKRPPISA
jgi:hypothetical protein